MPAATPRPFVWYELLTSDAAAAKAFYTKLFGWGTQAFEAGGPEPYEMWTNDGNSFGGVMRMPAEAGGAPPLWMGYVGVEDVDAMVARVKEKGGAVHVEPRDVPDTGRFAVVADPSGASFALWQSRQSDWQPPAPGPGYVSWRELATDDTQAGFDFYADLFGWTVDQDMDMGPELGIYRIFRAEPDTMSGGIYKRPKEMPVSNWLYYVEVEGLDGKVATAQEMGGKLLNGPMDVPGGRIVQMSDPQGAMFAMHEKKKEA